NRDREFSRRQTVEHTGAAAPQHADRLLESHRRHSRYQNTVRPANLFLNFGGRILCLGIDRNLGSELSCQCCLFRPQSTAATCSPIALAYWIATWPNPPPAPEITSHSPGRVLVSLSPL